MFARHLFLLRRLLRSLSGRLLRCDHVIQFGRYGIELALQLVDGGAGRGLLCGQVSHGALLAVTVTECESCDEQQGHAANQNPAVDTSHSGFPIVFSFLMLAVLFHSRSSSVFRSISRLHNATPLRQKPSTVMLLD